MGRRPDFIIIGAMKGATSTLHEQLAAQPGVFMCTPKEPGFFSQDKNFERGIEWYESLFSAAESAQRCGEASTCYTKFPQFPDTVDRMNAALPDAKLIYVMRHPIQRLVSHYIHAWSQREYQGSLRRAVEEYAPLVDCGRYAMQLAPYLQHYGPERILLVFAERFKIDPQRELERIGDFLGLEDQPRWQDDLGPANVSRDRMRRSTIRDALVYAPGISQIRERLPQSWRDGIKRLWQMRRRPELESGQRERLTRIFDEDLARLGQWLDTPINCATFNDVACNVTPRWSDNIVPAIEYA